MIYIRADANETIGTGHVMRCLSIAEEIRRQGEEVTFIVADQRSEELIKKQVFPSICLDTVWNDLDQEIESMLQVIDKFQVKLLLIDSYFVTEQYLKRLGQHTKLAYIDDINSFLYPVDLLINYNIFAESLHYTERYEQMKLPAKMVLGCRYVPLRKEFCAIKREFKENVKKVLITSGGTDPYHVMEHLLEHFKEQNWFDTLEYHVIIGKFNLNKEAIMERWSNDPNIQLHCNVSNMSYYMQDCDIAITAGGVTTYELMACGIPSILYTLADNQLKIAEEIRKRQLMVSTGDVRTDLNQCMEKITDELQQLIKDPEKRKNMSKRMMQTVDGNGCKRLVQELFKVSSNTPH